MIRFTIILISFLFLIGNLYPQGDSIEQTRNKPARKGWTWAALPALSYDADQGWQLGLLGQIFDYGDGSTYPEYRHTLYAECSWFTKGSAVYQLYYDSKYLIPGGVRITADLDYIPEKALDFTGFNGYQSRYDRFLEKTGSPEYVSRMYYKMERLMYRAMVDFQGPLLTQRFRWLAGVNLIGMQMATVDIGRMNKGKPEEKKLPDTSLLFDKYVRYGLIAENEKDGGVSLLLKAGFLFDSRDNEASPGKGMWSELLMVAAPGLDGNSWRYLRLSATHRQYFTLWKDHLISAYRIGYQGTIAGEVPYYMLPYMFSSNVFVTKPDGLGGAKNLRGVLRNRVVGDGVVFGNLELRWNIFRKTILKQHITAGLIGFMDGGMVVDERPVDYSAVPDSAKVTMLNLNHDRIHVSTGLGLRAAINHNFVIAVDYGLPLNRQDGQPGIYVGIGHIF